MTYEIWFGDENTEFVVDYSNDIWIDSLLDEIEYLRKYYPNKKLWLKKINQEREV